MNNASRKRSAPNYRLREEREQHSWTHKDVADLINLPDPHTVGRWERGTSFPSPHYRRELCRIFGKSLGELDLLRPLQSDVEPPLASSQQPAATPPRLPIALTSIMGREQEINDVSMLLKRTDVRLLTLAGTGGIGKTRLAIEVATRVRGDFNDGIHVVLLAALRESSLVVSTIAASLGIKGSTTLSSAEQVKAILREKQALLILDNFEHVAISAPFIEELLASCAGVKVLVTSRQLLHLEAEYVFTVSPLLTPNLNQLPQPEALEHFAAIALFVQRAQMHLPEFKITPNNATAIAQLCIRLDGLPLAIELAAARIQLFSPQMLLARLSQGLHMLKNDFRSAPDRHYMLYDTMKWSYDLLNEHEKWLFRHLAVFVGGARLETLEEFFHATTHPSQDITELVFSLLNKSLLQRIEQENGELRFIMLETIRDFGINCLHANGEVEESKRRYATYYLQVAERVAPHLKSSQQEVWLTKLEEEHDNLRAALGWLIEQRETELALRFCEAFGKFWGLRGYWREEQRWLKAALLLPQAPQHQAVRCKVLRRAGHLAYRLRDLAHARTLLEQSVTISREINDQQNLAGALSSLGWVFYRQNEVVLAGRLLKESVDVARSCDDNWVLANTLESIGRFLYYQGDIPPAYTLLVESVTISRELQDKENLARILATLVTLEIAQGNIAKAEALALESNILAKELGTRPLIALTLDTLGEVAMFRGAYEQARQYFEQRIAMAQELGDIPAIVSKQVKLADIALAQKELEQAAKLVQALLEPLREQSDTFGIITALCILGDVKRLRGEFTRALTFYQDALKSGKNASDKRRVGRCIAGLAQVFLSQGHVEPAIYLFRAADNWLKPFGDLYPTQRSEYEQAKQSAYSQLGDMSMHLVFSETSKATLEAILHMIT